MMMWFQKSVRIIISLFLLVVIAFTQLAGVLHSHTETFTRTHTERSQTNYTDARNSFSQSIKKRQSGKNEVINLSLHCKICDLTHHQHTYHAILVTPGFFHLFPQAIKVEASNKSFKLFETAVQCWTNKGPPAVFPIA